MDREDHTLRSEDFASRLTDRDPAVSRDAEGFRRGALFDAELLHWIHPAAARRGLGLTRVPGWLQKFRDFRRDALSDARLAQTIERLVADGELAPQTAERLTQTLRDTKHESQYIVGHLSAHLAIGVIFLFDVVPLPLGTIARGAWVAGNRIYTTVRREPHRAKVHSFPVLLVSLIPFVGYFAYLIPLRATNADAAYLYANHIAYLRSDCSLEQSLQRKPRWLQGMIRGVLASVMEKPRES